MSLPVLSNSSVECIALANLFFSIDLIVHLSGFNIDLPLRE